MEKNSLHSSCRSVTFGSNGNSLVRSVFLKRYSFSGPVRSQYLMSLVSWSVFHLKRILQISLRCFSYTAKFVSPFLFLVLLSWNLRSLNLLSSKFFRGSGEKFKALLYSVCADFCEVLARLGAFPCGLLSSLLLSSPSDTQDSVSSLFSFSFLAAAIN